MPAFPSSCPVVRPNGSPSPACSPRRPALILADEPTGQLDHATAATVIDVLLATCDELGAALVVSTHDPVIAARLPQEWVMHDGFLARTRHRPQPTTETRRDRHLAAGTAAPPTPAPGSAALGIAVAVALLASLGSFLAHSKATMTDRALRTVAVDWQVQVQPGADPAAVLRTVASGHRSPARPPSSISPTSADCRATTTGSTQTTGAATVLGIPPTPTGPPSPARSEPSPDPTPASSSPSRPPPTCTPHPATASASPAPDCRRSW